MRCEGCDGKGRVRLQSKDSNPDPKLWIEEIPCPECGGCGVAHCCDGLVECDTESEISRR